MTGEFRLLDKRNGHEHAAVLFYRLTMLVGLCLVAHYTIHKAITGYWQRKIMIKALI